jgi:SDR family mycofactocin-dependent oxidoreductase
MSGLEGKVAFITGAARGQGRNHAVRLAEQGVDIIALDINESIPTVAYDGPTDEDLAETVRQVEALDRRIHAEKGDVRDLEAVRACVDRGVAELGRLDIVIANAGIASIAPAREMSDQMWHEMIDINLNGVWHTVNTSLPHMKADGTGGSIVLIGSVASYKGMANLVHYVAAKHAVVGMTKSLATELGPEYIRVNAVCPTNVDTPMVQNEFIMKLFMPELEHPTREDAEKPDSAYRAANAIPVPWIDVDDVTNAILFLVSDEARFITGTAIPIDAGFLLQ